METAKYNNEGFSLFLGMGAAAYFVTLVLFAAVLPFTVFGQSAVFWFN